MDLLITNFNMNLIEQNNEWKSKVLEAAVSRDNTVGF